MLDKILSQVTNLNLGLINTENLGLDQQHNSWLDQHRTYVKYGVESTR
jgi:hypothetical protein